MTIFGLILGFSGLSWLVWRDLCTNKAMKSDYWISSLLLIGAFAWSVVNVVSASPPSPLEALRTLFEHIPGLKGLITE